MPNRHRRGSYAELTQLYRADCTASPNAVPELDRVQTDHDVFFRDKNVGLRVDLATL